MLLTNEILGFLCVVVIAVWSLLLVALIRRTRRNDKRKNDNLENDLHY